jgi:Ca2+-binding EF-hand superfamily protein
MKMKQLYAFAIASLAFLLPMSPACAEPSEVTIKFVRADADGDGVLSKAEVLIISLQQFIETDSDRDGALEEQEVGEVATDPEFKDNDADKSGSLSVEEMIEEKLADFAKVDTNNDGVLDFEEVSKYYEAAQ